jgi:endonuclease/exonuclease/phosphatase family metal-dependent hydrolase
MPLERRLDHSFRNMVLVELRWPAAGKDNVAGKDKVTGKDSQSQRTIRVLLTHVNRRYDAERQLQLRAVIALYLSLAEPAVLLGDLNSTADDPQIQKLLKTPGVLDVVGEKTGEKLSKTPPDRIDWIIARGLRCVDAGLRDNGASDHPAVWAELELPQSP